MYLSFSITLIFLCKTNHPPVLSVHKVWVEYFISEVVAWPRLDQHNNSFNYMNMNKANKSALRNFVVSLFMSGFLACTVTLGVVSLTWGESIAYRKTDTEKSTPNRYRQKLKQEIVLIKMLKLLDLELLLTRYFWTF